MAVTVKLPTQLRDAAGGATSAVGRGRHGRRGARGALRRARRAARPALRRRRRPAPLRQRLHRRRGHPLPRRARHARLRRRRADDPAGGGGRLARSQPRPSVERRSALQDAAEWRLVRSTFAAVLTSSRSPRRRPPRMLRAVSIERSDSGIVYVSVLGGPEADALTVSSPATGRFTVTQAPGVPLAGGKACTVARPAASTAPRAGLAGALLTGRRRRRPPRPRRPGRRRAPGCSAATAPTTSPAARGADRLDGGAGADVLRTARRAHRLPSTAAPKPTRRRRRRRHRRRPTASSAHRRRPAAPGPAARRPGRSRAPAARARASHHAGAVDVSAAPVQLSTAPCRCASAAARRPAAAAGSSSAAPAPRGPHGRRRRRRGVR